MFIALDSTGKRIDVADAEKGNDYFCPVCNNPLRIKEGNIKVKHFAHISKIDCDDFTTDMSEWHRKWQEQFPVGNREVVIEHNGEKHRADVLAYGHVIEFQHSPISLDEFERRNKFYTAAGKKVVWVFDLIEENKKQMTRFDEWHEGNLKGGKWRWSYSWHRFKHFSPQEEQDVILFFQFFDKEQAEFYLERVIWADSDWQGVSFKKFDTIYFPQTKTELLDWIKNRKIYDEKERKTLRIPETKLKVPSLSHPFVPAKSKTSTSTPPVNPQATHIPIELKTENMSLELFHQEIFIQDKNGNRVKLCTECNGIFVEYDMSDYQYSKGICKACMRKKSKGS